MAIGDPLTSRDQLYGRDSVDLVARTLWGEARGDSGSRVGIAYVINNRKNNTSYYEFRNLNTVKDVVLAENAFSCFNPGTQSLQECLKPDTSSPQWANIVRVASNLTNYPNPIAGKCFYSANWRFAQLTETRNGKLYYSFPGGRTVEVTSKIVVSEHTFFDYTG
ncbi:hypothetical protein ACFW1P_11735 [Paenibacillus sp. NPDC058910]|uniref:hypothetical protein n=1 Tax=unclassified Paenibacillus TaxID=185978 RepID=UPI003688B159